MQISKKFLIQMVFAMVHAPPFHSRWSPSIDSGTVPDVRYFKYLSWVRVGIRYELVSYDLARVRFNWHPHS